MDTDASNGKPHTEEKEKTFATKTTGKRKFKLVEKTALQDAPKKWSFNDKMWQRKYLQNIYKLLNV